MTAPSVVIVAPIEGATIGNGRVVQASAGDAGGAGVAEVEVRWCRGTTCAWVDGRTIGSDTVAPYAVAWNNQPVDGTYTLLAWATDHVGNRVLSMQVTVEVRNSGGSGPTEAESSRQLPPTLKVTKTTVTPHPRRAGRNSVGVANNTVNCTLAADAGEAGPAREESRNACAITGALRPSGRVRGRIGR